jgi:chloramphenicol-sensitive protein RarD
MLYAAGAYVSWGLLPIFWKSLHGAGAFEILAHRVVWGLLVGAALIGMRGRWGALREALRDRRTMLVFAASSLLLALNWFVYIWAVNSGHIVETSLGYFINPLVNVALGVIFLRERLRLGQGLAVGVALLGVLYLTLLYGAPPWIALTLALSFGAYGLLRKTAPLASLEGFTLETLLMGAPALAFLLWLGVAGGGAFGNAGPLTTLLLVAAGVVTAVPLLLFAAGARAISMTTLGVLQYISPSLQITLGVTLYGEQLSPQRLLGFGLVWLALAIYSGEGLLRAARRAPPRSEQSATLGAEA